jgi:hypothetical protein
MQTFMWAIVVNTVKTTNGKQLIRLHEGDAQLVFAKLHEELKESQKAEFSADDLEDKLKDLAINKWTGTYVSFLENWSTQLYLWCELVTGNRTEPQENDKKKLLKTSVSTAPVLASIATQETIDIAKGHKKWTYNVYFDILMRAAIDDDRAKKRVSKGTKTTSQLNRAERKANSATTDGGRGRGRGRSGGRGRGRDGRGRGSGRGGRDSTKTYVEMPIWKQLTPEVQAIIRNSTGRKTSEQHRLINATQMAYGAVLLPEALWSQLPPGAQTAITTHNNTLNPGSSTTQVHSHTQYPQNAAQVAHMMNQMSGATQIAFGVPPPATPQFQQVNAHGQDTGTISSSITPQNLQQGTSIVQNPTQPFLHNMMSSSQAQPIQREVMFHNGKVFYTQDEHKTHYQCSRQETKGKSPGALVDAGANGGFGGDDVYVLEWGDRKADVTGINDHKLEDLHIVTCLGKIMTTRGPAIAVMHQYAYHGKGKTIHAPVQMSHFGHDVNDKSIKSPCGNGKQRILTPDGYIIPLDIVDGLPYMPMSKPTEEEMDTLPHIIMTGDLDWDPRSMDHTWTDTNGEFNDPHSALIDEGDLFEHFDQRVTLTGEIIHPDDEYDFHFQDPRDRASSHIANNHKTRLKEPDYEALHPNFGWAPIETIKKTFAKTTQLFRNMYRLPLCKHFQSRFPGANVGRRHEAVAMDTYFSDTPAIGGALKMAQIYVGRKTLVTDVYPMLSEKQIPCTL